MKRVALLLLPLIAACASLPSTGSGSGADSPSAAIRQFLDGAKRRDLPAMAAVWGTEKGPAANSMNKKELERREFIMMQCLAHEKSTIGTSGPGEGGRLKLPVQLTSGARSASPTFTVVMGPGKRWYVENFDIDQLRNNGFCSPTAP